MKKYLWEIKVIALQFFGVVWCRLRLVSPHKQSRQGKTGDINAVPYCCSLWTWVSPATHLEEISYKQRKPDSFWENLVADLLHETSMPAKDKNLGKDLEVLFSIVAAWVHCVCLNCVHIPGVGAPSAHRCL